MTMSAMPVIDHQEAVAMPFGQALYGGLSALPSFRTRIIRRCSRAYRGARRHRPRFGPVRDDMHKRGPMACSMLRGAI